MNIRAANQSVAGAFSHCRQMLHEPLSWTSLSWSRFLREDIMRCARKIFSAVLLLLIFLLLTPASVTAQAVQPFVERLAPALPPPAPVISVAFNTPRNFVALGTAREIRLLNAAALKPATTIPLEQPPSVVTFTPDGAFLFAASSNGVTTRWNLQSNVKDRGFAIRTPGLLTLHATAQGQLFSSSTDAVLRLTDPLSGNEIVNARLETGLASYDLSGDAKIVLIASPDGVLKMFSLPALKLARSVNTNIALSLVRLSADANMAAIASRDGQLQLWDVETLTLIGSPGERVGRARALAFDPHSRWLAVAADSAVALYDLKSRTLVKALREEPRQIGVLSFVGEDQLWGVTASGEVAVWRVLTEAPDAEPPVIALTQPVVSAGAAPKIFSRSMQIEVSVEDKSPIKSVFVQGLDQPIEMKEIPAAAGTPKRYGAVVQLLKEGTNSFELTAKDAYGNEGRMTIALQRLSDQDAVEILSPSSNAETDSIATLVRFRPWFAVDSYKIVVNMQEMSEGSGLRKKPGDVIMEGVPLVAGYNQIQLVITGAKGEKVSKSFGVTRKVVGAVAAAPSGVMPKVRDAKNAPQKWAVIVGTSEYANRGISPLKYADADAEAFAKFLQTPEGGGFEADHMRILLNKDATLAKLQEALIDFLQQAIDKDLVIIYFAGHGLPDPARPQNLYLLTYDADPARLGTTSFPMWQIRDVLERHISAKRIVVFSDACHSGGISVDFAARGLDATKSNLINQYLADLSRTKEGIVIFTASASGEVSQEIPELGHGVFTYYLLQGMKGEADFNNDYTVTINELMQFVEDRVKRKTKGAQNPMRSQTVYDKDMTISQIAH